MQAIIGALKVLKTKTKKQNIWISNITNISGISDISNINGISSISNKQLKKPLFLKKSEKEKSIFRVDEKSLNLVKK